jgi:hypothetical protein
MPLVELQTALAHLYTDTAAAELFARDPAAFAREHKLTERELAQLQSLPAKRIRSYARSLTRKRINEARRLLPLTAKALGTAFDMLFSHYASTALLDEHPRYVRDACSFARFLEVQGVESAVNAVARFETANLQARMSRALFRIESFAVRLPDIIHALGHNENWRTVPLGRSFALWIRWPGAQAFRRLFF